MQVRRRIEKRRAFTEAHREQLLHGPDAWLIAGEGYLASPPVARFDQFTPEQAHAALTAMREDWARHGPTLMREWRQTFAAALPWAAEQFGEGDELCP
jgi:hypothetical protein